LRLNSQAEGPLGIAMHTIAPILFNLLRQMDAEAVPTAAGAPTGLNWYGGHIDTRQTEPAWSKRLVELLRKEGFTADCECRYDKDSRDRCDVVINLPEKGKFWIELKGAWKEYWRLKKNDFIYRSYLLHPLVAGLDESKSHTVPLDIKKLERLPRTEAAFVGVLLIGFDSDEAPMDADAAELIAAAGLGLEPWSTAATGWRDSHRTGGRVRCWFWYKKN
jgi:hypothetical protein